MMDITCLITTYKLNRDQVFSLLNTMNLFCKTVLRNQTNFNSTEETIINNQKVTIVNATDSGLSVNRNELLKLVDSEYIIFADDDEVFFDNALAKIEKAFSVQTADAFAFNYKVLNQERKYEEYHGRIKKCSKKSLMSSGVYRFIFKFHSIKNLFFDEKIGSGSEFLCGEDSVFVSDFLKRTNKCYFCEDYLFTINQGSSLWYDKIGTDNYLYAKGYVYKKIYGWFYPLACLRFLAKTKRLSIKNYRKTLRGPKMVRKFYK